MTHVGRALLLRRLDFAPVTAEEAEAEQEARRLALLADPRSTLATYYPDRLNAGRDVPREAARCYLCNGDGIPAEDLVADINSASVPVAYYCKRCWARINNFDAVPPDPLPA